MDESLLTTTEQKISVMNSYMEGKRIRYRKITKKNEPEIKEVETVSLYDDYHSRSEEIAEDEDENGTESENDMEWHYLTPYNEPYWDWKNRLYETFDSTSPAVSEEIEKVVEKFDFEKFLSIIELNEIEWDWADVSEYQIPVTTEDAEGEGGDDEDTADSDGDDVPDGDDSESEGGSDDEHTEGEDSEHDEEIRYTTDYVAILKDQGRKLLKSVSDLSESEGCLVLNNVLVASKKASASRLILSLSVILMETSTSD